MDEDRKKRKTLEQMSATVGQQPTGREKAEGMWVCVIINEELPSRVLSIASCELHGQKCGQGNLRGKMTDVTVVEVVIKSSK